MALSKDMFSAIAQNFIIPEIQDNIYLSNVLFYRMLKNKQIGKYTNNAIQAPLLNKKDVAVGTYTRFGLLDSTPTEPWTAAEFQMGHYYAQIPLAIQDFAKLDNNQAKIDYVKART